MKVLVLGGGNSPEREVSLRSAKAVAEAARQAGYEVSQADPADGFKILDKTSKRTVVLPILHGVGGEDGVIQNELEKRGLAFLGSDSRTSHNCFDKWLTRSELEAANIPMPLAARVNRQQYLKHPLSKKPHALKILHGGSSIGTLIVRNGQALSQEIEELFSMENDAVIEQLIIGVEANIAILDQSALTPIEIRPPEGGEFDYENKYNGKTTEICPPESISFEFQTILKKLSERVHKIMGVRHLSRVDIMIDKNKLPYVLEINTMPGMTDQSLYPKEAAADGISMPKLVTKFVEMVARDYKL